IATETREHILHAVATLPGASIGIAGPRGVGKSTLLWSLCANNPTIAGRPALAVYTSAPVEYEARDFLLHVYASLCRQVLKTKGVPEEQGIPVEEEDDQQEMLARRLLGNKIWTGTILIVAGVLLLGLGLLIATVMATRAMQQSGPSAPAPT